MTAVRLAGAGMLVWLIHSMSSGGLAQQTQSELEARSIEVESHISAVTLYRGRASVTRSATITLEPGAYELRFANLPASMQPATLQARTGGTVKVIGVEYAQEPAANIPSGDAAELDMTIEDLQRRLRELGDQRELIQSQEQFVASITVKATSQASDIVGTEKLELDSLRNLMKFMAEERTKLMTARRELDANQRELEKQLRAAQGRRNMLGGSSSYVPTAVVSIVAPDSVETAIELSYLVAEATWEPVYNIRASLDGSSCAVEYAAVLTQRSGEDWNDVTLTLSTAQPTIAANPPALQSWFVDIRQPWVEDRAAAVRADEPGSALRDMAPEKDAGPDKLAADAEVGGAGPSVTFQLPRAVTVKSNSLKHQRTRIANVDTHPKFVHVAIPALTEAVYIRGELTNSSPYHLLPGKASIFIGQDYVGPTTLESVAPNGAFKIHFGVDPAVRASRHLISKHTENTGLLSGGRRTSFDYRVTVDNGCGKPVTVELWDRYPVSRNEQIQIELVDLSAPLSNDAYYITEERPQGLLKWILSLPGSATGKAAYALSYGVRIDRAKDIEMTPLPE